MFTQQQPQPTPQAALSLEWPFRAAPDRAEKARPLSSYIAQSLDVGCPWRAEWPSATEMSPQGAYHGEFSATSTLSRWDKPSIRGTSGWHLLVPTTDQDRAAPSYSWSLERRALPSATEFHPLPAILIVLGRVGLKVLLWFSSLSVSIKVFIQSLLASAFAVLGIIFQEYFLIFFLLLWQSVHPQHYNCSKYGLSIPFPPVLSG